MPKHGKDSTDHVHCRTGSLEILRFAQAEHPWVHCRTGSLEMLLFMMGLTATVHCRTGSLEKVIKLARAHIVVH